MRKWGIFKPAKIDKCLCDMEINFFIFFANSKIVQPPSMLCGYFASGFLRFFWPPAVLAAPSANPHRTICTIPVGGESPPCRRPKLRAKKELAGRVCKFCKAGFAHAERIRRGLTRISKPRPSGRGQKSRRMGKVLFLYPCGRCDQRPERPV